MGLKVKETDGWKNRANSNGSAFYPRGAVTHHTAGPHSSPGGSVAPSLGIIINGRSDLPGPLANIYIDFAGTVYVIAAGGANHAGTPDGGSCKGMTGNSSAWGLEIEHPGTVPLPGAIADIAAAAQAAMIKGTCGADMVVYHKEWAPSRKIDLATTPTPAAHRERVKYYLSHPYTGGATPPQSFVYRRPLVAAALQEDYGMPPDYVIHDTSEGFDGSGNYYGCWASGLVRRMPGPERTLAGVGKPDGPPIVNEPFNKENSNAYFQLDQAMRGYITERK
jgi:hypothetical protein